MRLTLAAILLLTVSGCSNVVRGDKSALCTSPEFEQAVRDHAAALADPATPDLPVTTGARLIRGIDAYCT